MNPKIIQQGAEAIILLENNHVIKHRIKKSYRIPQIDQKLRLRRTKAEAKILEKLKEIIPVPKVLKTDKENITLEFIEGKKLSENLEKVNWKELCEIIGQTLTKVHNKDIIHGDLTTSNMIYNSDEKKIYFIDFGLGFHSKKIEDKAVDLHLLKQALEAKHYTIWQEAYKIILNSYNPEKKEIILKRVSEIEKRGRYRH